MLGITDFSICTLSWAMGYDMGPTDKGNGLCTRAKSQAGRVMHQPITSRLFKINRKYDCYVT